MDSGKRTLITWMVVVAIVLIVVGLGTLIAQPFKGKYVDTQIIEVKGTLTTAKLFCDSGGCKWLWTIQVESATQLNPGGKGVLPVPDAGKKYTFDIPDSKANNYVKTEPDICHESGVTVCEHEITESDVVIYYTESIGSSGLPELIGAVY